MDFKDYDEILGVLPDVEKKVIKQTYRQLAPKYHPDLNPGNKEAEEKFKMINEAYQVLSDTEKRKKYIDAGDGRSPRLPGQIWTASLLTHPAQQDARHRYPRFPRLHSL